MIKYIQGIVDLMSSLMKKYGISEDIETVVAHKVSFNVSSKKWEVKNINRKGIIVDMVYFNTKKEAIIYLNTFYPQNTNTTQIFNKAQ